MISREHTANAISLSSITATVRSKGVACPKCLTPVRDQLPINLTHKLIPVTDTKNGGILSSHRIGRISNQLTLRTPS